MAELTDTDIREQVRERYAAAAAERSSSGCCGSTTAEGGCGSDGFGHSLYDGEGDAAPTAAVEAHSVAASRRRSPTTPRPVAAAA